MVPRLLKRRVAPLFWEKGVDFHVQYVRSVRNWKDALPGVASLSGAYRRRTKRDETVVPHSFTFLQRCSHLAGTSNIRLVTFLGGQRFSMHWLLWNHHRCNSMTCMSLPSNWLSGMPSNLLEQAVERMPQRFRPAGNDVFCLVKACVSDPDLSQPALLVLPGQSAQTSVEPAIRKLALGTCARHSLESLVA